MAFFTATLSMLLAMSMGGSTGVESLTRPLEGPEMQVPVAKVRIHRKRATAASRGGYEVFLTTAYCPCEKCCDKTDGITATQTRARAGRTIAVDPREVKLGSKVTIAGHEYTAEDTGGAIRGKRIDIYFDSHQDALEYGVKYTRIRVK